MKMNQHKRRLVVISGVVLGIVSSVYTYQDVARSVKRKAMETVLVTMGSLGKSLEEKPAGIARVEDYLANAKSIQSGYAPAEFKKALEDYLSSFEEALTALKAGQDTKQMDERTAEAKQRMVDCYRKYR